MLCFENERPDLTTRQTMKYQNELANQSSLDAQHKRRKEFFSETQVKPGLRVVEGVTRNVMITRKNRMIWFSGGSTRI
jgi:hypothetical protein